VREIQAKKSEKSCENILEREAIKRSDYRLCGKLFVDGGVGAPMLRDEGRSIRHRVEERPESSIAASVVIGVEDAGINVHRDNLKTKRKIRDE